jgi:hypothetical protein
MAVHLTRSECEGVFEKCCISSVVDDDDDDDDDDEDVDDDDDNDDDDDDDDMLWNGSKEGGDVRSECVEEEDTD